MNIQIFTAWIIGYNATWDQIRGWKVYRIRKETPFRKYWLLSKKNYLLGLL